MINPKSKIPRRSRFATLRGKQNPKFERGFTIIEALVSIVVLSIGITSCVGLASYVLKNSEISKARLIAVNLAQEGVEVVRNIRDANWLAGALWDTNLGAACYEVEYNSSPTSISCSNWPLPTTGNFLKIDTITNKGYSYSGDTITTFRREIKISYPQSYEMKIECQVYWTTQGTSKKILIIEHLYDWK